MIAIELALLLLPAQQPVETTQPAPAAPRRGMLDLQWNGPKVQLRQTQPTVDFEPVEVLQYEPAIAEPVIELRSFDPLQAAPSRQGRSWIGVELSSTGEGDSALEVGRTIEGSPAERARLQPGDRLLALDGERLGRFEDLRGRLDGMSPGTSVRLTIGRDVQIRLDERGWGEQGKPRLGVHLSEGGRGLLVESVESGWPAEASGLRAGDRLIAVEGQELSETSDLIGVLSATEPGQSLAMGIERELEFQLGTFPEESAQAQGGGAFQLEVPEGQGDPRTFEGQPPQVFGLPHGGGGGGGGVWRIEPAPHADPHGQSSALESELRSLRDELRSLREELRALRSELDELRRSGAARGR